MTRRLSLITYWAVGGEACRTWLHLTFVKDPHHFGTLRCLFERVAQTVLSEVKKFQPRLKKKDFVSLLQIIVYIQK